jgi:signal transduction histidine kinase
VRQWWQIGGPHQRNLYSAIVKSHPRHFHSLSHRRVQIGDHGLQRFRPRIFGEAHEHALNAFEFPAHLPQQFLPRVIVRKLISQHVDRAGKSRHGIQNVVRQARGHFLKRRSRLCLLGGDWFVRHSPLPLLDVLNIMDIVLVRSRPGAVALKSAIEHMKRSSGLSASEISLLASIAPALDKHLAEISATLFEHASHEPDTKRLLPPDGVQLARLKQGVLGWLRTLFAGVYDDIYIDSRRQVGARAARAGFEEKHLIGIIAEARAMLCDALLAEFPDAEEFAPRAAVLNRALDSDLSTVCEAFSQQRLESLKRINEQLEQTTLSLAQASITKDEFLAHVSHELRTPLNSVLGFTRLILDGLCESREEEQQMLRDIFASSELVLRLVNDLLDLSRVNADQFALQIRPAALRQLLDSTLPLIVVQAQSKKIQVIDETLDCDLPLVLTDELRFRQVLLNVLSNALKFTDKGAITIRAFPHADENTFCLEIEDTGLGVPAAERSRVFKKFARSSDTAPQTEGVGLGLAIAKQMIERMGGRIGLESGRRGKGTVIWFTVPLAAMSKPQAHREARKHSVKASA